MAFDGNQAGTSASRSRLMLSALQSISRKIYEVLGRLLENAFGSRLNPLHHLGALTIFFFWIVLVSGIWLFIFFRTSIEGAYQSVEYLTHDQWYLGGVMRSLHRYASDAAIVTLALHILREWSYDRHRGKHWFSWVTGIPLLWIIIPLGITGYWLVWDKLALYVALTSAELLDALPIFTGSMVTNFLSDADLSDRFFTLMAFLHLIGLPLFLVFAIWLHVFRISQPGINPPRALMAGSVLAMLALSLVYPALSQGQAELAVVPQNLGLDWYYLLVYPLTRSWSPGTVWALLGGISLLLFAAPWLPPRRPPPVAEVNLANCNGCRRCADDCPYGAITMQPRSDGSRYEQEAVVEPDLCVSCGICVGSCPTATPFRTATALLPGIDLPDISALMLRQQVENLSAALSGSQRVILVGCDGSDSLEQLEDSSTAVLRARCAAHLPPSFVDYILSRGLADGVFFAGCQGGSCRYRLGDAWTEARMDRTRDPRLRQRVDDSHIALGWLAVWRRGRNPARALSAFRQQLGAEGEVPGRSTAGLLWRSYGRGALRFFAFALFAVAAGAFSAWPAFELIEPDQAVISLSFTHAGQRIGDCRQLSQEELNALPPNMRKPMDCPRSRRPLRVTLRANETLLYDAVLQPSGIWKDGESSVHARFEVPAGAHRLMVSMSETGSEGAMSFESQADLTLVPGQHLVIGFDANLGSFSFR